MIILAQHLPPPPHCIARKIKIPRGEVTRGHRVDTCHGREEEKGQGFPGRHKRPETLLPSFPEDPQQGRVKLTPHQAGDGS